MPAAIIGGVIAGAGALGGAAISSSGAGKAADAQAGAAEQAAQLQYQSAQNALGFQEQQYANQQQELSPWYMQGQAGLANLSNLLGLPVQGNVVNPAQLGSTSSMVGGQPINARALNPALNDIPNTFGGMAKGFQNPGAIYGRQFSAGSPPVKGTAIPAGGQQAQGQPLSSLINPSLGAKGSLLAPWTQQFQAPTNVTEQNDPGYQFRLNQGTQALQNSAAAKGDLLSGNTLAGITQYGQDYASNEYQNVYNRAFNQYATQYNQFKQNQADIYNRLASISGLGQTTAGQLGMMGQNSANSIGNTLLSSAGQIGNSLQNAGAATASGYASQGNIWEIGRAHV